MKKKIEKNPGLISFRRETKDKVKATKDYFNQYWTDLIYYVRQRKLRNSLMDEKVKMENFDEKALSEYRSKRDNAESEYLRLRRTRMLKKDFALLAILGKGGFGEVYLARKKDTGEILALKKMNRKKYIHKNETDKVKRERSVMSSTNSPWLIQLKYAFKDSENIYLAMEFLAGGDMKNLLDHVGCFSIDHACFYFSEMVLSVEALHKLGYIHRDLKPDNFMVDRTGHIKLIDFGLSKEGAEEKRNTLTLRRDTLVKTNTLSLNQLPSQTIRTRRRQHRKIYSIVGSPEYMAVDILNEKGYDHTVDFWSLGVILYELLFGVTPFMGESIIETFQKLNNWTHYLVIPPPEDDDEEDDNEVDVDSDAWKLIKLLIADPEDRVGSGKTPQEGSDEIKSHRFFANVDFGNIITRTDVPFHPKLEDDEDTSYFRDAISEEELESMGYSTLNDLLNMPQEYIEPFSDIIQAKKKLFGTVEEKEEDDFNIYFKNSYEKNAFAGWTFRHEDMEMLLKLKSNIEKTDDG